MAYAAQDFRDLLALARLLRRHAQEETYDGQHELLLGTAAALETRAFALANAGPAPDPKPHDDAPPMAVNVLV